MDKETKNNNIEVRSIIIKGWSGMLFLLLLMMITDLVECGMKNDFRLLLKDPGVSGLNFIAIMTITNVLIQIAILTFENQKFKLLVFVLTLLYTLVFIGHQANHLIAGEGIDIHFFLDLSHHLLGIWATVFAFRWVQIKE